MGKETKVATKQLEAALSNKCDQEHLAMCGYVRDHLSLILVQAFSLLVRGPRISRPHTIRRMTVDGVETSILVMQGD